ncbi:ALS2 C-terminal-like protein isoform 2-T2 [Anomaloglossus baeobatrachus]|uniref:ALS2 C-terminal-like protein isoform X2 n=1 Tax=Anomaloglossus baeobatrachus TaxID=238106 RepID=UPI003F507669
MATFKETCRFNVNKAQYGSGEDKEGSQVDGFLTHVGLHKSPAMSRPNKTSLPRRPARRDPSGKDAKRPMDESAIKKLILIESETLLKLEEDFSSSLSQISTIVLSRLLQVTDVADILGGDYLLLLRSLSDKFHAVWEVTARCFQTLKETSEHETVDVQDLYLLTEESQILQVYTQYVAAFTHFLVMKGFEKSAKQSSSYWKGHKKLLLQLLGEQSDTPVHLVLQSVFIQPFTHHVQQYSLLLSRLSGAFPKDTTTLINSIAAFGRLQTFISQALDEASQTKMLWSSVSSKLVVALCTPDRRLQEDSKQTPVTVMPGRYDRVLLFNDLLVFLQGNEPHICDLQTVWVDTTVKQKSDPNSHVFRIVTPEEELFVSAREQHHQVLWSWKVNQLIRQRLEGERDFPLWGRTGESSDPPTSRLCKYTYRSEGRYKNAAYEGDMSWGKPHGKGTIKWADGRNHVGDFNFGQEDGFGICLIPDSSLDRYDCYKCHWRNGTMYGYGICEYADESVYKGYFKDNLRHGFGVLENRTSSTTSWTFTGNWEKDKRSGYGVWETADNSERYIGMWQENQRHGLGIVLLNTGACYQGVFSNNKLVGPGVLITEDNNMYEGEFTEQCFLSGKGKLTFANGFTLVGTFNKSAQSGLQTQGVLTTASGYEDEVLKKKFQFGAGSFPVEERWQGIFEQFHKYLESGCKRDSEESFLGFHVKSSKKLQKPQEYLFCPRSNEEEVRQIEDGMKELRLEAESLHTFLEKAFNTSHHPLKKVMKLLLLVFQATYSGLGANLHLLSMAQEEIKYYAKKLWEFFRVLIAMKAERSGRRLQEAPDDDEISEELNPFTLVLPAILPRFHPDLFMLYMLYRQQEDALYWQGIVRLGHLTDTKLLEFLDVQRQLWPLKDVKLTANQRYSIVRHKCFQSATECLQKIISTVDPKEKLEIILKTYLEIEKTVSRVVSKDYKLPMDDLLPLLIYVVSRAGIQHLGAEIHFIQDLMDPINRGGINDFLLTALESCYEHIQKEEIRLFK